MKLTVDLHSHSGYSGGVGKLSLDSVASTMGKKGINVFGTGDCLHATWMDHLKKHLEPEEEGLFSLSGVDSELKGARFLLQTEIIVTSDVPSGGRKGVHTVILFPNYSAAEKVAALLEKWDTKLKIGRPFLKCLNSEDVAEKMSAISAVDELIQIIPAHVLTPQGIFGSDHPIDRLADFYGDYADKLQVFETGLSADPLVLALIPELDGKTLISNSDCHSSALNRVGREFTSLDADSMSYQAIIEALRARAIDYTAEFTPSEGRYFLTGHREGKKGHENGEFCYFSPDKVPADEKCPICGGKLTIGVLQRALQLSEIQGEPRTLDAVTPGQNSISMVPLLEVIASSLGVKNSSSKKVLEIYHKIIQKCKTEEAIWRFSEQELEKALAGSTQTAIIDGIMQVIRGEFTFEPLGYDGTYGELSLGQQGDWFGHEVISR